MDLPSALELLGLARGADEKAVRRAYLRLLREHPPERDPEGFQRLRAAFELAQRFAPSADLASAGQPLEAAPSSEPAERHEAAAFPVPFQPAATAVERRESTPDPLEPYRRRCAGVSDDAAREAIAREAVATLGSADSYELWLDAAEHSDGQSCAILREAIARGHRRFLERLRCYPGQLDDDELDAWVNELDHDHSEFLTVIDELLERRRVSTALTCALAQCERLRRAPFAPRPFPQWGVDFALGLLERRSLEAAARFIAVFEATYQREDLQADAARLALTRELISVHTELDQALAHAIAVALRVGAPERADKEVASFATFATAQAKVQAKLLKKRAPMLANLYANKLAAPDMALKRGTDWSAAFGGWLFGPLLILALRLCSPACQTSDPSKLPIHVDTVQERDRVLVLCEPYGDPELCSVARAWKDASDCPTRIALAGAFERAFNATRDPYKRADNMGVRQYVREETTKCDFR